MSARSISRSRPTARFAIWICMFSISEFLQKDLKFKQLLRLSICSRLQSNMANSESAVVSQRLPTLFRQRSWER